MSKIDDEIYKGQQTKKNDAAAGTKKETNVTKLERVDSNNYYNAERDAGSVLGKDLEGAYWGMFNGAGGSGGGGGGGDFSGEDVSLAGRSQGFMDYQDQTTKYMSNQMKEAGDMANSMFGQGALNQMTADNDITVQADIKRLEEQFGGNVNHPAFIKAKNELISASKMYNARAFTDLRQKAGQYGIAVGEMAKNYYDVFSSREEEQQKLKLATDQFNAEMKLRRQEAAASAANAASSRDISTQLAALSAISANRKFEAEIGLQASTTELEARSADKVSMMNYNMEKYAIDTAAKTAKAQQKSNIFSSILGTLGSIGGFLLGGPVGAAAGGAIGGFVGSGSLGSGLGSGS
jgi:hypothetical protein